VDDDPRMENLTDEFATTDAAFGMPGGDTRQVRTKPNECDGVAAHRVAQHFQRLASYGPDPIGRQPTERTTPLEIFPCDADRPSPIFCSPEAMPPRAFSNSTSLKEIVMSEELDMELEIVELGDAKEETKGLPVGNATEPHPVYPFKIV